MSYGAKYRVEFTDTLNREVTITIKERDYVGSVTEPQGSGTVLKTKLESTGDSKFERLKPTASEIGIMSRERFEFEDIFTSDDRKYLAEIEYDSVIQYKHYLLPDVYNEPYRDAPYSVFFTGSDGTATLTGDHSFEGLVTGHDVLFACFDELDLDLPLYDASYIYPDGADTDEGALHEVQFSADRWVGFSLKECLDAVLSSQACVLIQEAGAWHVIPFELRGKEYTRTLYNASGVRQSQGTFDPVTAATKSELADGSWRTRDQVMLIDPARKNIQVDNDIGAIGNLVTSGDLNRDDIEFSGGSPTVPVGWTDNGLNIGIATVGLEDSPDAIIIDPSGGGTSSQISEGSANIDVQDKELQPSAGDKLLVSIRYRFRFAASATPNFVVRVGDYWLRRVGDNYEWTGSFSTLSWRTYESQEFQELIIETPEIPSGGNVRFAIYNFGVAAGQSGSLEVAQWVVNYLPEGIASTERFTTSISRDINAEATPVSYTLIHGDAPATISPGALFFNGSLTANWNRRGKTDDSPLRNIIARTLAKLHQSPARRITGSLRGNHSWINAISDQGKTLVPVGGSYNVRMATYNAEWVEFFENDVVEDIIEEIQREQSSFQGRGIGEMSLTEEIGLSSLSIGYISEDLDGTYTEIPVVLDAPVRVGFDYWIVDEVNRDLISFTPNDPAWDGNDLDDRVDTYGPGTLEALPIEEQVINAAANSIIVLQPGQGRMRDIFPEFDFVSDTLEIAGKTLRSTMDFIAQGVNFGKANSIVIDTDTGNILLSEVTGDLDDVSNGSNFGKVSITSISAGKILIAEAEGDLDDIANGTNFGRVAITSITAGGIVLLSAVSGDLDDVDNGTNFGKVNIINIDAATGKITLVEAIGDIDDIADGGTYSRILATEVSAGHVKILGPDGQTVIDQGEIDTDSLVVGDTVFIGNQLSALESGEDRILIGNSGDETLPYVRAQRDANNYVQMVGRPSASGDHFFRVRANSVNVFEVGADGATIGGFDIGSDSLGTAGVDETGVLIDKGQLSIRLNDMVQNRRVFMDSASLRFIVTNASGTPIDSVILLLENASGTSYLTIEGLPTSDPGGSNRLWNNSGSLSIT